MIVEELEALTALDVIVNVAEVAFAATVTVGGTVAADVLLLERFAAIPPAGAAAESVTVPVELAMPPITLVGLSETDETETPPVVAGPIV